jgi:hypothetical protein
MAAQSSIKLSEVRPYLNQDKADAMVAGHYGQSAEWARTQVAQVELNAVQAGF